MSKLNSLFKSYTQVDAPMLRFDSRGGNFGRITWSNSTYYSNSAIGAFTYWGWTYWDNCWPYRITISNKLDQLTQAFNIAGVAIKQAAEAFGGMAEVFAKLSLPTIKEL